MSQGLVFSVVAPAYNEADGIEEFHRRLHAIMESMGEPYEVVYVNDGSKDGTLDKLHAMQAADPAVTVVNLSRNFGKEIAMTAGLDHAVGDAVIVIDTDLQDPPEIIPQLVEKWREGYDVAYARRLRRDGETALKKLTAGAFYRLMQNVGPVAIPKDTGDFRLMSRRAVNAVCQLRESHRFMKGLFTWVGFKQTEVTYVRDARLLGDTKWNYWRLWNLAVEGITSFTLIPLKAASFLGVVTAIGAFIYGTFILFRTLIQGIDVPGYASLIIIVLFLGGVQLIALGVLGEYLGRTFNEVKGRPLYFVEDYRPARASAAKAVATVAREARSK